MRHNYRDHLRSMQLILHSIFKIRDRFETGGAPVRKASALVGFFKTLRRNFERHVQDRNVPKRRLLADNYCAGVSEEYQKLLIGKDRQHK